MVRRQNNQLIWFQKNLGKLAVSETEPGFGEAAATEDLQIQAEHANFTAEEKYLNTLATAQENINMSRPIPAIPVKPLYVSVSDPVMDRGGNVTRGVQITTPWPEPLPELTPKMVFKAGSSTPVAEPIVIA